MTGENYATMAAIALKGTSPSRTGSVVEVDASAGNGNASVTVPGDAGLVVAFFEFWRSNDGEVLTGLTLDGNSFIIASMLPVEYDTSKSCVGVAWLENPSIGVQDLAWTYTTDNARGDGGIITLVYVKDVNPGDPVRAASTAHGESADTDPYIGVDVSVQVVSKSSDLLLAFAQAKQPGLSLDVQGGELILDDEQFGGTGRWDLGIVKPSDGDTVVTMTGEFSSSMAAVCLNSLRKVFTVNSGLRW